MIWCDIIDISFGLSWFAFGVVWCLMVWFGVIFKFFCVEIDVLLCYLGVVWF